MNRVVHFELAAENPERAAEFYRQAFGWEIKKWDGPQEYWLATTGAAGEIGIDGGILPRRPGAPPTIATIGVESVDAALQQVLRCGGKLALPKMAIPGVGYQAHCLDTEGVVFGLHQSDPSAR